MTHSSSRRREIKLCNVQDWVGSEHATAPKSSTAGLFKETSAVFMVLFRKVQWAFGFSGVGAPGRWGLSALLERLGVGWPHPSLFSSSWL